MASNDKQNSLVVTMIAVMASAVLLFWSTGLHPRWWLTWFAPLPVLLIASCVSGRAAFGWATLAWCLGGLNLLHYLVSVGGPPEGGARIAALALAFLAILAPACVFGFAVVVWRVFVRRGSLWRAALALPALWVAYEYILGFLWPHGTWGNLAYTQMDFLPFIQLASLTGVWGMSFVLLLFPATIAALLASSATGRQKRSLAFGVGVALVAILGFGWGRLRTTPNSPSVVVGLIASDTRDNAFPQPPDQAPRLMQDYLEQATNLAAQGAKVIVMPEKLGVVVDPNGTSEMDAAIESVARNSGVQIVTGLIRVGSDAKWNEARWYFGSDLTPAFYDKEHMLPAFESSFRVGTNRVSFDEPSGKWGVAICKDMDFPQLSRHYGADKVGLMLVPAWDFGDDGWQHGRMAILRGVDSGFSIARAPKQGLLTITDDRGRVLAERSSGDAPFATLVAQVPVRSDVTLYRLLGDWFAWLDLAVLVWLVPGIRT